MTEINFFIKLNEEQNNLTSGKKTTLDKRMKFLRIDILNQLLLDLFHRQKISILYDNISITDSEIFNLQSIQTNLKYISMP